MTKKEFDDRMVTESTNDEYAVADSIYMASNMDKDEFCQQFKKHDCKLLREVTTAYYAKDRSLEQCKKMVKTLSSLLLDVARDYDDTCIRDRVCGVIGIDEYVRLCLTEGYELAKEDREYILMHLR